MDDEYLATSDFGRTIRTLTSSATHRFWAYHSNSYEFGYTTLETNGCSQVVRIRPHPLQLSKVAWYWFLLGMSQNVLLYFLRPGRRLRDC